MYSKSNLVLLRSALAQDLRIFFSENGYVETFPPEITTGPGSCENIQSIFTLDYFGRTACLSQTSQLYLEAYIAEMGIPKTYSMFKSFRAEKKADGRRLTEFSLFEFEEKDLTLTQLINLIEALFHHIFLNPTIASYLNPIIQKAVSSDCWTRITYSEAVKLIQKTNNDFQWGQDFSEKEEAIITDMCGITFVTHYPTRFKFFNMRLDRSNNEVVENCDVLLPGVGEVVGGSVRETDVSIIRRRLHKSPILTDLPWIKEEDFEWYMKLFEGKEIYRAGAGIGFERVVQFILQEKSIINCMEFPRSPIHIIP